MVVKMMKWRPWPPLVSRKYEVRLIVRALHGYDLLREGAEKGSGGEGGSRFAVEIRWKGPKLTLSSLRRSSVARNFTREVQVEVGGADEQNAVVFWDEQFQSLCTLSAYKDSVFHPWEIAFTLFNGLNQRPKGKVPAVGTASLNLAEFASAVDQKDFDLNIPLKLSAGGFIESSPSLSISISLVELRGALESTEQVHKSIVPVPSSPAPSGENTTLAEKDELSTIKAGLRKVKILTEFVSTRKAKKAACHEEEGSEGNFSSRSEDGDCNYPFDSDSLDDFEEGESEEIIKEDSSVRKSFSYGKLPYANAGGSSYSSITVNGDDDDWVYYSKQKSDVGSSKIEDPTMSASETVLQGSRRSILPWRKRKLSFRSPKSKGEPLLKKAYGEEGGDDIDFDRRQLSSDESLSPGKTEDDSTANRSSVSEFGDDNFAVGSWEQKEVLSRDGHMKLQTQVFFASIDQRSERAAGESACTALVAVIANWFQNNHDLMPIKSQFDSLIREGSLEWRNLCENQTYRERFPDKHFDLETVIQAKIRPLSVVPGKSFIGFFHPEGMDEGRFDFLHGAMSFDNIWDEISHHAGQEECTNSGEPQVYIISWNDHFFILKVEADAYYIIDTLGERLYEGCNQAYILKFDSNTVICKMQDVVAQSSDENSTSDHQQTVVEVLDNNDKQIQPMNGKEVETEEQLKSEKEEEEVVCRGKEACKEYIKSFLAAIPIRELQEDVKKGLNSSTPLHQRLQIEFHYTQLLQQSYVIAPVAEPSSMATTPETLALCNN